MREGERPQAPKPYPALLRAVADGLDEVFGRRFYADRVVAHLLKRDRRWGSRDRAFVAETLYDCVRWWRLLCYLAESDVPERVISAYWTWKFDEALRADGFRPVSPAHVKHALIDAGRDRALLESIPDWLDARGAEELGSRWSDELAALNQPADVYLRVNTLKGGRQALKDELEGEGVSLRFEQRGEDALRVVERRNLWQTAAFKAGRFEVQDLASQQVAPALDVAPGMLVVDACAGAGGKSLHLAALMQNKGRLIAMDAEEVKLAELKRRARRGGISNLDIRPLTPGNKVVKRLTGRADRVLLDVPCSGLGVLRRNPDAKWKLSPEFLERVRGWQHDILRSYSRMVKPGGKLVYATCSVLPSEGSEQVAGFLEAAEATWTLAREERYEPSQGYDGFYVAQLTLD